MKSKGGDRCLPSWWTGDRYQELPRGSIHAHTGSFQEASLLILEGERYIRQRTRHACVAAGAHRACRNAYLPALRAAELHGESRKRGGANPGEATGRSGPRKWPWCRKPSEGCVPTS